MSAITFRDLDYYTTPQTGKGRRPTSFADRFWAKVHKSDGCWLWAGAKMGSGYGHVAIDGVMTGAHRVSWFLTHGTPPPDDLQVCHTCDVKLCVRPAHLFLGTNQDNMADKSRKGRCNTPSRKGERNSFAKLTDESVRRIRAVRGYGRMKPLVEELGISLITAYAVRSGRRWRHVL